MKAELRPIAHVTNHTLRRTYMSLLYEAGATPAYVMNQAGHESAAMALEVYAKVMARKRDTGAALDELVRGPEWAQMGTNRLNHDPVLPAEKMSEPAKPLAERA